MYNVPDSDYPFGIFKLFLYPIIIDVMSYKGQKDYGATAAYNFGVPDRLFKRHGRWRSENAKDGYVKDSFNDLLFVSKI
jgi:hypothetical protein